MRGAAAGDLLAFAVLDADGTEDVSGAIATVADATAVVDAPAGNPAVSTTTPARVTALTLLSLTATDASQAALAPVNSGPLRVVPSQTYAGRVINADGQPLPGALVATVDLDDEFGNPWSAVSGADGTFSLDVPAALGGHTLQATHPAYVPQAPT